MKLSIIIISFNTKEVTKNCLVSIYQNLPEQTEVIVVDNNSHDGSCDMIRNQFPEVNLIENKNNSGFAAANNQGMEVAKGKYFLILNSDTIILENALIDMINFMENHPEYGACSCQLLNDDKSLQVSAFKFPHPFHTFIHYTHILRLFLPSSINYYPLEQFNEDFDAQYISGACIFISKEAYEAVGGLNDTFFFYLEDVDWCKRINDFKPIRYLHNPKIIHLGGGSASRISEWSILQHRRSNLLYYKLHFGILGLFSLRILFFLSFLLNTLFSFLQILKGKSKDRELQKISIDLKALFSPAGGKEPIK